jgi:hypothetical protein
MIWSYNEFIKEGTTNLEKINFINEFIKVVKYFRNSRKNKPDDFESHIDYAIGDGTYSKLYTHFEKVRNSLLDVDIDYLNDRFSSIIEDEYTNSFISLCILGKDERSTRKDDTYSGYTTIPEDLLQRDYFIDWLMCDTVMIMLYCLSKSNDDRHRLISKSPIEELLGLYSPGIVMSIHGSANYSKPTNYPYDEVIDNFDLMIKIIKNEVVYSDIFFLGKWDPEYHRYKKPDTLSDYSVMITLPIV